MQVAYASVSGVAAGPYGGAQVAIQRQGGAATRRRYRTHAARHQATTDRMYTAFTAYNSVPELRTITQNSKIYIIDKSVKARNNYKHPSFDCESLKSTIFMTFITTLVEKN